MEQYINEPLAATNILRALLNPAWKCTYQSKDQSSSRIFFAGALTTGSNSEVFQEKGLLWSR